MSTVDSTPVSPAPVWDVINGFTSYWALSAALDLGLFDALAKDAESGSGLDAAELAAAIGAAEPGKVTVLAETLVALGLLAAEEDRFRLAPAAERYLVSTAPASMAALVRYSPGPPEAWPRLADTVRTGAPEPAVTAELAELYPALVRATGPTQTGVATAVATELERRGLWPEEPTIVDFGCGSGAWLTALLRTRPNGTVIAVDRPNVLPIAEQAATDAGLREQVIAVAGDYLEVALPVASADVVVLAHVLRAEPAERARRLLARAVELAGAGGVVVVVDYTRPDPAHARQDDSAEDGEDRGATCIAARHELLLSLTMLASTAGLGVTVADLRAWAEEAGAELVDSFEPVPRQHIRLIRSRTPEVTS
ncbi:class I SAM-dependent methyltransferase [Streptomyces albipurpureus]|uniref:Methyltransferase domain-containing protein n=1 Tax=Streptomyces albipurpureus TaxID=2897419 RepID=A0ABT0UYG3_9ACTN|nr:class I SAM-dependent methyltransferase [Streptomyces sp. CWNU-1]MCM2393509.1 methyltransferase domain-containing protein [Streptomyces sp. CWNU-1]